MIPGKTYIGRLPGDRNPSFVRKRSYGPRSSIRNTISQILGFPRLPNSNTMMSWSHKNFLDKHYEYDYVPHRRHRVLVRPEYHGPHRPDYIVPEGVRHGRLATNVAQTCAACGKFRSPSWSSRHGLTPGDVVKPGLCKKCRDKSTSSEESDFTRRERKEHRHCHHGDTSSEEDCPRNSRRYRSSGRYRSHSRRTYRSPPRENVNIVIENEPIVQTVHPVVSEPSSSAEEIEIVRKTLPRSRSRHSLIIEGREEHRPRHRMSFSSVRVVRSPSPRRHRVVPGYGSWPRHRRRRSTSHVSFVNEHEEIIASRPRYHTRRSRVYYDGANSGQSEMNSPASTATSDNDSLPRHPDVRLVEVKPTDPELLAAAEAHPSPLPLKSNMFSPSQHANDSEETIREFKRVRTLSPSTESSAPDAADIEELRWRELPLQNSTLPIRSSPDLPDHPDHLVSKLSATHITPVKMTNGESEIVDNTQTSFSSQDTYGSTLPTTPTDSSAPYYRTPKAYDTDYASASHYGGYQRWPTAEEAEYLMELGRQQFRAEQKEREERERLENAYTMEAFWEGRCPF